MKGFTLRLQAADRSEEIGDVVSFVGEDASGRFGILGRHDRFMTVLAYGLARYRRGDGHWEYLALPGGVLYFVGDTLYVTTRHYLRGPDARRVGEALTRELREEEQALADMKDKVRRLEEEMLRRLLEAARE
jgi:F-type H+-transporting ATPase subunit epsilon